MDIPRQHTIREAHHRILDPFTDEKLATLGRGAAPDARHHRPRPRVRDRRDALHLGAGPRHRRHGRRHELGVRRRAHANAPRRSASRSRSSTTTPPSYVAAEPVDVAACVGASWIGGGVVGTLALLERSLKPGGLALLGEPFWREDPPDDAAVLGSGAPSRDLFLSLPGLVAQLGEAGWDLVEMVLADEDSWDRYVAAQWLTTRQWLDANPTDELWAEMRAELDAAPLAYVTYQRRYLGWGVFALMKR